MRIIFIDSSNQETIIKDRMLSDQDMIFQRHQNFKSLIIEDMVNIDQYLWNIIINNDKKLLDNLQSLQMDLIYFQIDEQQQILKNYIGRQSTKMQFTKLEITSSNIDNDFFSMISSNYIEIFDISKCFNISKFNFIFLFKNLRSLKLDGTKVDNEFLIKLTDLDFIQDQLEIISIGLCQLITDQGTIPLIKNCRQLKEIDLTWTKVIQIDDKIWIFIFMQKSVRINFIQILKIIQHFIFNQIIIQISDQTILEIIQLKFLKNLKIGMCFNVNEQSLKQLFQSDIFMESICELDIAQSNINLSCVESCRISDSLRSLKIYESNLINSNELNLFLKNFKNLIYLNISSTKADDQIFESLKQMQNLKCLIAQRVNFSTKELQSYLKVSPQIKQVDFSQNKLSQDFLKFVCSQNNLNQIDIRYCMNEKNQLLIMKNNILREDLTLISEQNTQIYQDQINFDERQI